MHFKISLFLISIDFRKINIFWNLVVQIEIILSSEGSKSLDFQFNPRENDKPDLFCPLYYLYDLCTCSDLDQN